MDFINLPILMVSMLFVLSILTSLVSNRANIPLILIFLCTGLIVGDISGGSIFPSLNHPKVAFFIGSIALAFILFDSGYQTSFKSLKKTTAPSCVLATLGVFLTCLFLAPAAKYILGLGWLESFLLTSVISSTDSATVFFLLRKGGVSIREKIKSTLEVESGSNDPMAIFLTFSFLAIMTAGHGVFSFYLVGNFFLQLGVGLAGGFAMGYGIRYVINRISLDTALYPILVICMALSGFAITNMLFGSGFLALYVAGFLLGNSKIQGHHQILRFQNTLSWLAQIIMFLTLGFFANIENFPELIVPSLALGFFLMLVARPVAVFLCLIPFKYTMMEKVFISFVGLRGATSILLALAPLVFRVSDADKIFSVTFLMVMASMGTQGFLIVPFAKWCKLALPLTEKPPLKTELDLPGLTDSFLVTYKLSHDTPAVLGEKIPGWARPIAVHRGDMSYNGANIKKFNSGDQVYLFASSEARMPALDKLYGCGSIAETEPFLGDFVIHATATMNDLKNLYGIKISDGKGKETLQEVMAENLSDMEIGDRFSLGSVDLVVCKVENGKATEIGIALDPVRKSGKKLFWGKKKKT